MPPKKVPVDVILAVKGAGNQRPDAHLDLFLNGFWPAVKKLFPRSTLNQTAEPVADLQPTPHEKDLHNHVSEIKVTTKTGLHVKDIWVREVYWEPEVTLAKPAANIAKEWRLASFALWKLMRNNFSNTSIKLRDYRLARNAYHYRQAKNPSGPDSSEDAAAPPDMARQIAQEELALFEKAPARRKKKTAPKDGEMTDEQWAIFDEQFGARKRLPAEEPQKPAISRLTDYWANFTLYLLLLLPLVIGRFAAFFGEIAASGTVALSSSAIVILGYFAACTLMAVPLTLSVRNAMAENTQSAAVNQGFPRWTFYAMLLFVIFAPGRYFPFMFGLIGLQAALLLARALWWRFRRIPDSDVDPGNYYQYIHENEGRYYLRYDKFTARGFSKWYMQPVLYRYLVWLSMPFFYLVWQLIALLKATKFLAGAGDAVENLARTLLSGYMGDVVNYALDPANAHRIRDPILDEIAYFTAKKEVQGIHVFAHSQGTPITYESIFTHIEDANLEKLYTYVTIGSVLSFYHQAAETLDEVRQERFPVSPSQRSRLKNALPDEFAWINFWNFTDPITEFFGLDEYVAYQIPPGFSRDHTRSELGLGGEIEKTSPTNVKSRASIRNHGEYWSNLSEIQEPLVRRVVGHAAGSSQQAKYIFPAEWVSYFSSRPEFWRGRKFDRARHHRTVGLTWALFIASPFLLYLLYDFALLPLLGALGLLDDIPQAAAGLRTTFMELRSIYEQYFPPPPDARSTLEQITSIFAILMDKAVAGFIHRLGRAAATLVAAWALLSTVTQFFAARRAAPPG